MMGKVLGLTGGIGSGKSSIAKMFSKLGIAVYYSDDRTKALYDQVPELLEALVDLLGPTVCKDHRVDRQEMARIVFANPGLLQQVEALVYPLLLADFQRWCEQQSSSFVIFESALLLEKSMFAQVCDRILTVSSPLEVRIQRVIDRDRVTREQVWSRMNHQWSDEQREALADEVLVSDNERPVLPQVMAVFERMMLLEKN